MMSEEIELEIYGILSILIGVIIIIGTSCKWRVFINPPDRILIFPMWPHALMKNTKYERFIPTYNMIGGIAGIVVGILFVLIAIFRYG
jgi:hypothetical protein